MLEMKVIKAYLRFLKILKDELTLSIAYSIKQ